MSPIDTLRFSGILRARTIDVRRRRLLVSRLADSDQAADLTAPPNCRGFGRVRHFRQSTAAGWPINPLPIVPACRALGIVDAPDMMTAQVFQNAACNWRCWYCYVPYNLLSADEARSAWLRPEDLIGLYGAEPNRPRILDLSGGSPDLVPEWVPWMMDALTDAGLASETYLWSDDNLSTTYLFERLTSQELDTVPRPVPEPLVEFSAVLQRVRCNSFWSSHLSAVLTPGNEVAVHLAVFMEPFLSDALSGRKTLESRFSRRRIAPFGTVGPGDVVLLKEVSGPIRGIALAQCTWCFDLRVSSLLSLRKRFAAGILASDDFWEDKRDAAFATIVELMEPAEFAPLDCPKRDRRGWVVLRPRRNQRLL